MKNKKKRFVIWGAWYGSRNVGDRLLLLTITDLLVKEFGPYQLTILSASPGKVQEYFYNPKIETQLIKPSAQLLRLIQVLWQCDLFIFGGGVPFFDQPKQAMIMLFLTTTLRIFRKPYFLWCVTGYKIQGKIQRLLYKRILNGARAVTCRDRFTINEFLSFGISVKPVIVVDSSFSLEHYDIPAAQSLLTKYADGKPTDRLFGLTPRTLRTKNAEAQTHYQPKTQMEIEHQINVYRIAANWLIENGYTPVFIPCNTNAPDDDRIVSREIISCLNDPAAAVLIDEVVMPLAAPALFSMCIGSVVSRVHGSVSSFLGGCPPIMYGFETKHKGIMETMKLRQQIFEPIQNPIEIIELIKIVLDQNVKLRESANVLSMSFPKNPESLWKKYMKFLVKDLSRDLNSLDRLIVNRKLNPINYKMR